MTFAMAKEEVWTWDDVASSAPSHDQSDLEKRNQEICRRVAGSETLEDIARDYGLTRERVRQIAAKHNAVPRRLSGEVQRLKMLLEIFTRRLSSEQAALEFGFSAEYLKVLGRRYGVDLDAERKDYTLSEIIPLALRVERGESVRSVCGADISLEGKVHRFCEKYGISSKHGRHRDFSARDAVAAAYIRNEISLRAAIGVLAGMGDTVSEGAFRTYVHTNFGSKVDIRKVDRKPRAKPKRLIVREVDVSGLTAEEAAIKYYGQYTSRELARATGKTRNAIIGIWDRAKKKGLLSD